jgi:hypothetical protein
MGKPSPGGAMTRIGLTFFMLLAVAYAQVTSLQIEEPHAGVAEAVRGLHAGSTLEFDALRQGTDEYAQILLIGEGRFSIASPGIPDSRLSPTAMEIEVPKGLHISPIQNPRGREKRFAFDAKPIRVLQYPEDRNLRGMAFKVRADAGLPPGEYTLKARFDVQVVNDYGIAKPQTVSAEIPITVVERNARVNSFDRSIGGLRGVNSGEWVGIILLAPLTVPLSIFMALIGWDGC